MTRFLLRAAVAASLTALAPLTLADRAEAQDTIKVGILHSLSGNMAITEYGGHILFGDELARLLGEQRPVRRRVHDDGLELLAQQATLLVLLLDEHQHDVLERRLAASSRTKKQTRKMVTIVSTMA